MTTKRIIRTVTEIVGALAVMVLLISWMSGSFGDKVEPGLAAAEARTAPADAVTAAVEDMVFPVIEEAAGTVQAARKTVVSSRITAVVREMRASAGDAVDAGAVLVVLDARETEARAQEARRAVEGARATRVRAEADFRRARQLMSSGIVSRSEFDQAESAFRVADAEYERVQQALEAAAVASSYAEIRSPVSGRVVDRFADPGDTTLPGRPLLALYDPTALRIEVPVRESLVSRLKVGDPLRVRIGSALDEVDGTIDEIVPHAEAGSRTFLVKIGLPKRAGVYTGMFGRVLIPAGERQRALIPESAVHRVGQLSFVEVVGPDRVVRRRLVTIGPAANGGKVEVLSGLRPGEIVLLPPRAASP